MRDRGYIFDGLDLETGGGKCLDCRLTAATRALHAHVDAFHAEAHRLARALLGGDRCGEGGTLLRSLEARFA